MLEKNEKQTNTTPSKQFQSQ